MRVCRVGRVLVVGVLALALGVAAAAPASAATPGLDGSYGSGGLVQLAPPLPQGLFAAEFPAVKGYFARDGSAFATESVSGCDFAYSPGPCQPTTTLLFRYGKHGAFDRSFGGSGSVDVAAWHIALATDSKSRLLLTGRDEADNARVKRLLRSGRPDKSFGRGGMVNLPQLGFPSVLLPAGRGRVLVGSTEIAPGATQFGPSRLTLVRLLPDGRLDRSFGSSGSRTYTLALPPEDGQIAVARNGAILILGGQCCEGIRLVYRISPTGKLDTRFNAAARGALGGVGVGGGLELTSLVARPNGDVDVFGVIGNRYANMPNLKGLELRLRSDGRIDRTFGEAGMRILALPVMAAAPGAGGGTITVAEVGKGGETITVSQLLPDGTVDPAFGGGQGVQIPQQGIHASVQPLAGGRAGIVGEGFQPCVNRTCILAPYLARIIEAAPSRSAGEKGGRS